MQNIQPRTSPSPGLEAQRLLDEGNQRLAFGRYPEAEALFFDASFGSALPKAIVNVSVMADRYRSYRDVARELGEP